jgi:hypothetical protein
MKNRINPKNKIAQVVIEHAIDESPDTSMLGKYTNSRDEWNIDRKTGEYCHYEMTAERLIDTIQDRIYDLESESIEEYKAHNNTAKIAHLQKRLDNLKSCCFDGNIGRNEYRYFKPCAAGEKPGTPDYKKYGKQDYERAEALNNSDWCYIGIIAKAKIKVNGCTQTITSGGLWGIESDSGKDYIEEEEKNQLSDLKENLLSLGFGTRAIQYAINNAERKE